MSRTCNYSGVPIVYTEVEVEVSLEEFEEKDIVKYMEDLGYTMTKTPDEVFMLNKLADAKFYNLGDFDRMFADFIYSQTGRII